MKKVPAWAVLGGMAMEGDFRLFGRRAERRAFGKAESPAAGIVARLKTCPSKYRMLR